MWLIGLRILCCQCSGSGRYWPRNFRFVLHAKGRLAQGTSSPEIEMGQTEESTLIYSVNRH